MHNLFNIIKKELRRFFTDKRILISLFLPGFLIYALYSLMGNFITSSFETSEEYTYSVYTYNEPQESTFLQFFETDEIKITVKHLEDEVLLDDEIEEKINEIKGKIRTKEIDILIVYDENFYDNMILYSPSSNEIAPQVKIYYNSSSTTSTEMYSFYASILNALETALSNKFDINSSISGENFDLVTTVQTTTTILTSLLPFLLITFLFSGCMSIAPDSIAGEKERGTIATLLVTPTKRSELALGKILSIGIASISSSIVSFIGLILSLPKLLQVEQLNLGIYGIGTYLSILIVIILTELLFVVILSIISAISKSVKEATSYCSAVMIVVMLIGATSMMGLSSNSIFPFIIPIYSSISCFTEIFALNFNIVHFLITIASNIVYIILGTLAVAKIFNSEHIISNN